MSSPEDNPAADALRPDADALPVVPPEATHGPAADEPAASDGEASAPAADPPATPVTPATDAATAPDIEPAPGPAPAVPTQAQSGAAAAHEPATAVDPAPGPAPAVPTQAQKRRRRPTAAERHRRVFFARLNELRASGRDAGDEPADRVEAGMADGASVAALESMAGAALAEDLETAPEAEVVEAAAPEAEVVAEAAAEPALEAVTESDAPAEEEPAVPAEAAPAGGDPASEGSPTPASRGSRESRPRTARDQARLAAAVERAGGPDVIREALRPKRDEAGKPLKWAAVCCEAARGLKPGDPVFAAWVRLAGTPVREIKAKVPDERPQRGGRGGGPGGGGGGGRGRPDGGGGRGRREERGDRSDRASREDMAKHAYGGRVGAKIVIPGFEPAGDGNA